MYMPMKKLIRDMHLITEMVVGTIIIIKNQNDEKMVDTNRPKTRLPWNTLMTGLINARSNNVHDSNSDWAADAGMLTGVCNQI